jgi:CRISPR/Cas system CSM-associated protein Csm3 (group 7 of RAMP superfamily)
MNPYDFVRFGQPAKREPVIWHDRFAGQSGIICCHLTAYTYVFIPQTQETLIRGERRQREDHQELKMMRGRDDAPLIPGSSLKGVLRSVAEALSGSCLTLPVPRTGQKIEYRDRPPVTYQIPRGFEHCSNGKYLCPACRLFGTLSSGSSFLGKVGVSDARPLGKIETTWLTIEALMEPKPRHRVWYENPQQHEVMRGRKFYYHHSLGPRAAAQKTRYNKTIEAIRPGSIFEYTVEYTNLTDTELSLLIFSLLLEPTMCHKIGMGKPVGLGSVKIKITGWKQIDRKIRYEQLGSGVKKLENEVLVNEVNYWRELYYQTSQAWQESLADLRRIWTWDTTRQEEVKYPPREWFRGNPTTPLEEIP